MKASEAGTYSIAWLSKTCGSAIVALSAVSPESSDGPSPGPDTGYREGNSNSPFSSRTCRYALVDRSYHRTCEPPYSCNRIRRSSGGWGGANVFFFAFSKAYKNVRTHFTCKPYLSSSGLEIIDNKARKAADLEFCCAMSSRGRRKREAAGTSY